MPKKPAFKWMKPINLSETDDQRLDLSTTPPEKSNTQIPTKKKSNRMRASFSQNDMEIVDLTINDEIEIPYKKIRLSNESKNTPQEAAEDLSKWIVPKTVKDLAIHPKKIEEVKGWFVECEHIKKTKPNPMLLVTGACGSGKLTTVKLVANEFGYDTYEYAAPLDYELDGYSKGEAQEYTIKESQLENVIKFLRETSKYGTIFATENTKKLLIIKDFPNVFIRSPDLFQNLLQEYSKTGRAPLIFITNDAKGRESNLNYRLFSDLTMMTYGIGQISFNPVSYTQMKKVLKTLTTKMGEKSYSIIYKIPSLDTVDSILLSSQGDLRNAIINLLFSCQRGQKLLQTEKRLGNLTETKTARKFKSLGIDENITMMHLLGKVFNPKYETVDENQKLTNNPEILTDIFSTQAQTCTKMIFVNYANRFTEMEDTASASDFLSKSDVLMSEWRDDILAKYGLNIGIRAAMVLNSKPVKGRTTIKGYKKLFSKSAPIRKEHSKYTSSKSLYVCDYSTYTNIIESDVNRYLLEDMDISFEEYDFE